MAAASNSNVNVSLAPLLASRRTGARPPTIPNGGAKTFTRDDTDEVATLPPSFLVNLTSGPAPDIFSAYFQHALGEENKEREIDLKLRSSSGKISSRFSMVRIEGLREALGLLSEMVANASVEAALADSAAATNGSGGADANELPRLIVPFDSIRAEVLPPSNTGVVTAQHQVMSSHSAALNSAPYPHSEISVGSNATATAEAGPRSESWSCMQRALKHTDYTSCVFHKILVPRAEVRARMNIGMALEAELTEEDALRWTVTAALASESTATNVPHYYSPASLGAAGRAGSPGDGDNGTSSKIKTSAATRGQSKPQEDLEDNAGARRLSTAAAGAMAGSGRQHQRSSADAEGGNRKGLSSPLCPCCDDEETAANGAGGDGDGVPEAPPRPLINNLTAVTYAEQELALRYLQGMCLCIYHQRRCIVDSCLVYYATDVLQCLLLHIEAVYQQKRKEKLMRAAAAHKKNLSEADGGGGAGDSSHKNKKSISGASRDTATTSEWMRGQSFSLLQDNSGAAATTGVQVTAPSLSDEGPVDLEEGLASVIIALIDCLEAACHYNPPCLTRLVQAGGVRALLNLSYSPCVPVSIRASVLDTISILLQEVAPFRRVVAAGNHVDALESVGGGGGAVGSEMGGGGGDQLLPTMIRQAITGAYGGNRKEPPSYMMDRASASKFDAAVREWFSRSGLSHVVTGVIELRDTQQRHPISSLTSKMDLLRIRQRSAQQREKKLTALLQAIDGKRAQLK